MDVIHHLFPESRIGRAVARGMRLALVACMLLSVTAALDMQLLVLLREWVRGYRNDLAPADQISSWAWIWEPSGMAHAIFSVWTYAQLVSYFVAACVMHPSRLRATPAAAASAGTADASPAVLKPVIPHAMLSTASMKSDAGLDRVCTKCRTLKLLRTHHCAVCGTCVELMDHHCPFTGNCVGLLNFRVFYLWICYGLVGIVYACAMSWAPFQLCFLHPFLAANAQAKQAWQEQHGLLCGRLGRASYLFLPAFFGALSTAFIWAMQSALIARDVTTIEYLKSITSLRIRMQRPEAVQKDDEKRKQSAAAPPRRKQASPSTASGSASLSLASADFMELRTDDGEEGTFELGERDVADMESGTPMGTDSPSADAAGSALSSAAAASPSSRKPQSYNPHKSFRLLVLQNHAWWTMLLPPWTLAWLSPNTRSSSAHDQRLHR